MIRSMEAFLQWGVGTPGPFQTEQVPLREHLLPWQVQGLVYTASGYGKKIPSRYQVQYGKRWRRVYCTQYSNAGSAWVIIRKTKISVSIY